MDYHNEAATLHARQGVTDPNPGAAMVPTCSPPPLRVRKTIPKAVHEIVGELKVRFQHTCGGDIEGFQARVALLAEDLWDAPPLLLRQASAEWVREHRFLPTAADLIGLMREALEARDRAAKFSGTSPACEPAQSRCDRANAIMAADPNGRRGIEWVVVNGSPCLRAKREAHPPIIEPVPVNQVERMNQSLSRFNATLRFAPDGQPFDLAEMTP